MQRLMSRTLNGRVSDQGDVNKRLLYLVLALETLMARSKSTQGTMGFNGVGPGLQTQVRTSCIFKIFLTLRQHGYTVSNNNSIMSSI